MNLPTEIFGMVAVVHTPDELGSEQSNQLVKYLSGIERNYVVLDLDNTESIDSNGLTALVTIQESLRDHGGDVKIATTNLVNRKILEITRIDEKLEVFESVVDAVRSFA